MMECCTSLQKVGERMKKEFNGNLVIYLCFYKVLYVRKETFINLIGKYFKVVELEDYMCKLIGKWIPNICPFQLINTCGASFYGLGMS